MALQTIESEDEKRKESLPAPPGKEIAVYVPVLATAIAITYDVGYFWGIDINLFTLFALSDHILFAIEALPMAFCISALLIADVAFSASRYHPQTLAVSMSNKMGPLSSLLLPAIALISVGLFFWIFHFYFSFITGMLAGITRGYWYRHRPSVIRMVVLGGALVLATAFLFWRRYSARRAAMDWHATLPRPNN